MDACPFFAPKYSTNFKGFGAFFKVVKAVFLVGIPKINNELFNEETVLLLTKEPSPCVNKRPQSRNC